MPEYEDKLKKLEEIQNVEIDRRVLRMNNILTGTKVAVLKKQDLDKQMCKADVHYWLQNWAWLYEPRPKPRSIPFCHWHEMFPDHEGADFQKRLIDKTIEHIEKGEDLRIEKSRDMGASWSMMLVFTYLWQFHDMTFLVGSRKESYVDTLGNLDMLLPKMRYLLDSQPKWLLPKGFNMDVHSGFMKIQNPETNGTVSGESNNANFGTGGRRNAILFDEYSKWEYTDSSAWTSAMQATPCRIALSTPLFKNNRFFVLKKERIYNITMHWSEHPVKATGLKKDSKDKWTSPWYEKQKERDNPDVIAQELDISYSGTALSSVFHEEVAQMRIERRITKIDHLKGHPVYWAFDPGIGDTWANGFYQVLGYSEEIRWFDYYENQNEDIYHYIEWVKAIERPWNMIHDDMEPGKSNYVPGWKDMIVIPDPNEADARSSKLNKSLKSILRENGFDNVFVRRIGKLEAISEAKRIFKSLWMDSSGSMGIALDRITAYHYKYDEKTQEFKQEPVHDINSHCCDQFKYFANYIKSPQKAETYIEELKDKRDRKVSQSVRPVFETGMSGA